MNRKLLAALGVLVLAGVVVVGGLDLLERRRTVKEIRSLRDQVYAARVSADSCSNELAYQERLFRRFDVLVDSMRGTVREFERLDARGVPENRYEEYLEHFDGYNDSVAAWRAKAQDLRATEAACRSFIERHNSLADSLRGRLQEAGAQPSAAPGG